MIGEFTEKYGEVMANQTAHRYHFLGHPVFWLPTKLRNSFIYAEG